MNKMVGFVTFAVASVIMFSGCTKSDDSKKSDDNKVTTSNNQPTEKVPEAGDNKTPDPAPANTSAPVVADLSETASSDSISIKRLGLFADTMDVFDPNPKGVNGASEPGALILALCTPRISDKDLDSLADAAYPIILTGNSQVLLHRDSSYHFGDGSNASSAPPYVLMTCKQEGNVGEPLSAQASSPNVTVKRLKVGSSTMEVLNPNPKGVSGSQQPGVLTLVLCGPRITDANLKDMKDVAYPITLTEGSQLAMRRDTSYQFGDGSNASSAPAEVVITCEK